MSNVISFPSHNPATASTSRCRPIAEYGSVGPVVVGLARGADGAAGLIHVTVFGTPAVGIEAVATLTDDDKGHAVADFTGAAVVRAIELAGVAKHMLTMNWSYPHAGDGAANFPAL